MFTAIVNSLSLVFSPKINPGFYLLKLFGFFRMKFSTQKPVILLFVRNLRTQIDLKPEIPISKLKKALKVAVIGCPNVGKSALTNELIKADLCAVSKRMDTTRQNTVAAITESNCQLLVVDSPGLVGITHARETVGTHTESTLLADTEKAIKMADHILVVHDATLPGKFLNHRVLHILHRNSHLTSSLVINKTDLIARQADLLELSRILTCGKVGGQEITTKPVKMGKLGTVTEGIQLHSPTKTHDEKWQQLYNKLIQKPTYKCSWGETKKLFGGESGWPNFENVFFVSALNGRGIDGLRSYLQEKSVPIQGNFEMNEQEITKKKPRQICAEHIRSEILNLLPGDVAYNLRVEIIEWQLEEAEGETQLKIVADVTCDVRRWANMLLQVVSELEHRTKNHLKNLFPAQPQVRIRAKFNKEIIS
uniref:G domain-containing protein n=1 Tax=Panagrolaimus sp. JU765 TaxID=591449 RepID=A0AC34QLG6_9BILA